MNQAIQLNSNIINDGELFLKNIPLRKGQEVEIIILIKKNPKALTTKTVFKNNRKYTKYMTGKDMLKTAGLWANRSDIEDSVEFVQKLRQSESERIFK